MARELSTLGTNENLFSLNGKLNEPERFPEIATIIDVIDTEGYRNGVLYAYLRHRFPHLPVRNMVWWITSLGNAGITANLLLETIPLNNPAWLGMVAEYYPQEPHPPRETIFIAWLQDRIPPELINGHPEFAAIASRRPLESMLARSSRRIFTRR